MAYENCPRLESGVAGFSGCSTSRQTDVCRSYVFGTRASESFALRLLNVSFLGVSFLLKAGLVSDSEVLGHTGAGEKHVNGDVRGGGKVDAENRVEFPE